jgi:drug/metabolite transporter (DMT)-like permease
VIYGLVAAAGWGLSDLWAAVSGRRIGSLRTVAWAQIAVVVALSVALLVIRPDLSRLDTVLPWLVLNGFLGAVAFAALYRALELGPIAIVSPVLASYAVVPVMLSVFLLDESLGPWEIAGTCITILGAVVTSTDLRAIRAGTRTRPPGLPLAIVSTVVFGVATYVMGWAAREAGPLPSLWFGRLAMTLVILAAWVVVRMRARPRERSDGLLGAPIALAVLVGLAELLGSFAYARGSEIGLVSIVTVASATYPLIPVFGGIVLLRERPGPTQFVGVALVIGGLMLLGAA